MDLKSHINNEELKNDFETLILKLHLIKQNLIQYIQI